MVADLLKELSNHNERVEERKGALIELLKIAREDSLAVWDEHFKTILLLLLETLGDKDVSQSIRLLAFLIDACYLNLFLYILCVWFCVCVCGVGCRAARYIACDSHVHLVSKDGSVLSRKSPSPAFRWSGI